MIKYFRKYFLVSGFDIFKGGIDDMRRRFEKLLGDISNYIYIYILYIILYIYIYIYIYIIYLCNYMEKIVCLFGLRRLSIFVNLQGII